MRRHAAVLLLLTPERIRNEGKGRNFAYLRNLGQWAPYLSLETNPRLSQVLDQLYPLEYCGFLCVIKR